MPPTRRNVAAAALRSASPRRRLLTTQEAAAIAQVTPACIRQWTSRGYLVPTARQGRNNLYREDHVLQAERVRRGRRASARLCVQEQGPARPTAGPVPGRRRPPPQDSGHQPRPSSAPQRSQPHKPQDRSQARNSRAMSGPWIRLPLWLRRRGQRRRQFGKRQRSNGGTLTTNE